MAWRTLAGSPRREGAGEYHPRRYGARQGNRPRAGLGSTPGALIDGRA